MRGKLTKLSKNHGVMPGALEHEQEFSGFFYKPPIINQRFIIMDIKGPGTYHTSFVTGIHKHEHDDEYMIFETENSTYKLETYPYDGDGVTIP